MTTATSASVVVASSSTALANLAYLIGAVVFAAVIGVLIWLRHRPPKSVDANMASFRRGLSALAPDPAFDAKAAAQKEAAQKEQTFAPAIPAGQVHVRLEEPSDGAAAEGGHPG